jgi:hypothetical protein
MALENRRISIQIKTKTQQGGDYVVERPRKFHRDACQKQQGAKQAEEASEGQGQGLERQGQRQEQKEKQRPPKWLKCQGRRLAQRHSERDGAPIPANSLDEYRRIRNVLSDQRLRVADVCAHLSTHL